MNGESERGLQWQVGVWDRMADVYQREIDPRFVPVVEHLLKRAGIATGHRVLDLGTGTGAVALLVDPIVGVEGRVTAVDISDEMLEVARARAERTGAGRIEFRTGRAESIPAEDASFDVVLASLSLMYVIDRAAAAREIARVLAPRGRFVAAVWAGPSENDIVRFQETAASFAPPPPVPGVGPGSLADPTPFLSALADAGLGVRCEKEVPEFEFDTFEAAWDALAGVTAAALDPEMLRAAKSAVRSEMWPDADAPRVFRNTTSYIVADKA